jgi:hypothetical protein
LKNCRVKEKQLCQQILNLEGAKINFICGGGGFGGWGKGLFFTFLKKTNYVTKFYTQKMQKLNNLTLQFFNEKFLFRIDSKKNYFFMQKNVDLPGLKFVDIIVFLRKNKI